MGELAVMRLIDAYPMYGTSALWRAWIDLCQAREQVGTRPASPERSLPHLCTLGTACAAFAPYLRRNRQTAGDAWANAYASWKGAAWRPPSGSTEGMWTFSR